MAGGEGGQVVTLIRGGRELDGKTVKACQKLREESAALSLSFWNFSLNGFPYFNFFFYHSTAHAWTHTCTQCMHHSAASSGGLTSEADG